MARAVALAVALVLGAAATRVAAGQFDGWSTGRATHVSGAGCCLFGWDSSFAAAAIGSSSSRTHPATAEVGALSAPPAAPLSLSLPPLQYDSIHEGSCMFGSLDANKGTGYDIAAISDKVMVG